MGLVNPVHLLLVVAVALIVIGPRRLPQVAHALGRAVHEFRDALGEGIAGRPEDPPGADASTAAASPPEHGRG
jgi:TatA/E family protein of Tat protein translocase